jgi:peptide/nickel transport system permease protein
VGRLAFQAITYRDFPVLMADVFFICVAFVLINLVVDLSYGLLDPRVRVK